MGYSLVIGDLTTSLGDAERRFTLEAGQWSIAGGEVIGLTGPSGTGKTLLLELLGMLRAPDSGKYRAEGAQTYPFDEFWTLSNAAEVCAQARANFFGFVPQAGGLLPFLTVAENVALTQRIAQRIDPAWQDHLLSELGLWEIKHLRPAALSIGQRQRVAIARALAHRPFCVIADEPTAALDPENATRAMGLLISTARDSGSAMLISSHDYPALSQFDMRRMGLEITSPEGSRDVVSTLFDLDEDVPVDPVFRHAQEGAP